MSEDSQTMLFLTLIIIIIITALSFKEYNEGLQNKEAIKVGLEQCIISDTKTIWVKDCEKTLKIYKDKDLF